MKYKRTITEQVFLFLVVAFLNQTMETKSKGLEFSCLEFSGQFPRNSVPFKCILFLSVLVFCQLIYRAISCLFIVATDSNKVARQPLKKQYS